MKVPLEDQRRARDIVATLIARGHYWTLPLFERIEVEIAKAEAAESTIERARAIAASSRLGPRSDWPKDVKEEADVRL